MPHFGNEVRRVQIFAIVIAQSEASAGCEVAHATRANDNLMCGLVLLHADLRKVSALVQCAVHTGIVKNFVGIVASNFDDTFFLRLQAGGRSFKVVIGRGVLAGPELAAGVQRGNMFRASERGARGRIVLHSRRNRAGGKRNRTVTRNQSVAVFRMLEVVKDTLIFEQAGDKIERCLAVLDAVFELVVVPGLDVHLEIGGVQRTLLFFENLGHNFRDAQILKDAAIRLPGKKPEPRHDFHLVVEKCFVKTTLREAAHVAVDVTRLIWFSRSDGDDRHFPQNLGEVDGIFLRKEFEMKRKRTGQSFRAGETL